MTKSNTPSRAVSHVSPCALNVKAWEFSDCVLPDIAIFSDPFPLTLQKQLGVQVGVLGARGLMNTLSVLFVHVFSSLSILQNKHEKK